MQTQKLGKIGSGGFGVVYQALIEGVDGKVAIKELKDTAPSKEERRRFIREVRIQSELRHFNILPVLVSDLDADPPWFAMPLAISNLADEIASLPFESARRDYLFRQILLGMQYAHEKGVVHRDLKPANILVFQDDQIMIGDFGLGKRFDGRTFSTTTLTYTKEILGTITYAAPEQMRGGLRDADIRSDIYSLGKIFYEMLTGEEPFPNLDLSLVDAPYRYIVSKCIENKPEQRFQRIDDLLAAFDEASEDALLERPSITDRAALDRILEKSPHLDDLDELNRILVQRSGDSDAYMEYLPRIRGEWLDFYVQHRFEGFVRVLTQYDEYVSGSLQFEYCDRVADFYAEVFDKIQDPRVQRLVLTRLLLMGSGHTRWYVMGRFGELIRDVEDLSTAQIAVEIVKSYPGDIRTIQRFLRDDNIRMIQDAIDEVLNDIPF